MLQNIHGEIRHTPINISTSGDTVIVAAPTPAGETHITAFSVIAGAATVLKVLRGTEELGNYSLAAGQTLSFSDIAGADGEPYIVCHNEDFKINSSAAVSITGSCRFAYKNF